MFIVGHRGCKYAKENTLDAFRCAIDSGVDMIELDIQPSKDMEIVVFHDLNCERLTPIKGLICDKKYEELKKYNIPSLRDVLELVNNNIKLYIEFKGVYNEDFLNKVINLLDKYEKDIYLASFNYNYFLKLLNYKKRYKIGYITCNNYKFINRIREANFISLYHELVDSDTVKYFKNMGLMVYVYTINRKSLLLNVTRYNVDGIISDVPNHIRTWLKK